ncbi:PAS domain S-box protein [Chitinophaga sp. Mgbs1]|uniref:Sensory/regulatory protein RpfC n=1 Tax=Chitinophaga solisilvae TaxID=1233460 RepID=A0A3S1JJU9_9BACT|nr:PAS domain S-box protein [Chitinophaga solisilvae]
MKKIEHAVIILVMALLMALIGFIFYAWMVEKRTRDAASLVQNARLTVSQVNTLVRLDDKITAGLKDGLLRGANPLRLPQPLMDSINITMQLLQQQSAPDVLQQKKFPVLQQLITAKTAIFRQVVLSPPATAGAIISGNASQSLSDSLKRLTESYIQVERDHINQYISKSLIYTRYSFWAALVICLFTLTLFIGETRLIFRTLIGFRDWAHRMQKSEQSFKRLAEEAEPVIFKANTNGIFTYVSQRAADITGYSSQSLIGKHFSIFLEEHEFDRLQAFYLNQLQNNEDYSSIQFEIITRAGDKKWVEQLAFVTTSDDGTVKEFQCIVKDIDKERRQDESIHYLQHRMEAILDYMPSMMFVKDMPGRYLLVNNRFMEIMQIQKEEIIGRTDEELDYEWISRYAEMDKRVQATGAKEKLEETFVVDGKTYHFLLTKFPLRNADNEMIGICCIGQDLTEKMNYLQQEKAAREKAEDAKQSQEIFLANMSHEIRTPMNGIVGMTQLLMEEESLTPRQAKYLDAITRSASNLLVIINEILDFSKIKAGKLHLENAPFHIHDVINSTVFPLMLQAREKGLSFNVQISPAIPPHLLGDEVRLNQVLINLIENAIKFTHQGAITLTVTLAAADKDNSRIRVGFEVKDTGIGIPAGKQHLVFESFSQTHNSNSREFGGTGLGLAICKELISLQQGTLQLNSTPGKGSTFYVEIPFTKNPFPPKTSKKAPTAASQHKPLLGKTLLVVEDNSINQQVAYYTLTSGGAAVDVVENGKTALELLRVKTYNCIIMDLQMPGMDGYETTRTIRSHGITTPVIAVTASAIEGERERCLQAGMNDYISKPYQKDDLFKKIQCSTGDIPPEPPSAPEPAQQFGNGGNPHPQPAPEQEENLPPISFEFIHEVVPEDEVKILLMELITSMPEYIDKLLKAVDGQNWEEAAGLAHQLKGNLGFVRMHEAVQLAHDINRSVKFNRDMDDIPRKAAKINELFIRHKPDIEAHIAQCI